MKTLLYSIGYLLIISCTKEYSVENPPAQIQPQPQTPPVADITGVWAGTFTLTNGTVFDWCWDIKKDGTILTYDQTTRPTPMPSGVGTWSINNTTFSSKVFYSSSGFTYTEVADINNNFKQIIGIERIFPTTTIWSAFIMHKQ